MDRAYALKLVLRSFFKHKGLWGIVDICRIAELIEISQKKIHFAEFIWFSQNYC